LAAFRPGSTAFGFWNYTQTCHCPTNSFAPPSDSLRPEPLLQSQLFQKLNHPFEQPLNHPSSQTQGHSHPPRRWASLRTSTSSTLPQTVNHVSIRPPPLRSLCPLHLDRCYWCCQFSTAFLLDDVHADCHVCQPKSAASTSSSTRV